MGDGSILGSSTPAQGLRSFCLVQGQGKLGSQMAGKGLPSSIPSQAALTAVERAWLERAKFKQSQLKNQFQVFVWTRVPDFWRKGSPAPCPHYEYLRVTEVPQ